MPKVLLAAALLASTLLAANSITPASAQSRGGTDKEQQACARDVTKFCRKVMNEPDLTVLACLKDNRPKISASCNAVLVSHGQ